MMQQQLTQKLQSWLIAFRLRTLLIPTIQVWTGSGVAYAVFHQINWLIALYAWLVAIFVTIGTNLINDAIDFKKGGDKAKQQLGQTKVIAQGLLTQKQIYIGGVAAFAFACAIPFALNIDMLSCLAIVSVCVICGYCYTGGPYPISYLGLSELFIFIFYGGVCVIIPYYAQTYQLTAAIFLAATQMGMLAILPNALNNYRDIAVDTAVNKKTLAVRFGQAFARKEIAFLTFAPYFLNLLWLPLGFSLAACLPFLFFPRAYRFIQDLSKTSSGPEVNQYFSTSVQVHFLFGLLLLIGLLL